MPNTNPPHASSIGRDRVLDVTVLVTEGSFASTAVGPIEIFHSAGRMWHEMRGERAEPRFQVRVVSVDGRNIRSLCALGLVPHCGIGEVEHTDLIVVPASGLDVQDRIARESAILPWLQQWYARGSYIAGICTGVAFLAEAGLLDGRRATTHWGVANILRQRYPQVLWCPEEFVTEHGRMLCSGGVYAAIDLSLYLVERFCGHEIALQCAKSLLLSMPRMRQSGYGVLPLSRPHADAKIREIEEHLQQHFDRGLPAEALAAMAGMSLRTFHRRFQAATGRMPGAYIQALRVAAAREMFEHGNMGVATVCTRIGYEDIGFFRRIFKRETGMTPSAYREQFGHMRIQRGALAGG